jgi:glutamyl-tRNA reductase
MTLIVVGISHRSAPFDVLDRVAGANAVGGDLAERALDSNHVAEAMALMTCNRVEIYADVDRFHGAVDDLSALLAKESGIPVADLAHHLYVHFDARAARHLMQVAAGMDSMVVGEQQILGQVRQALRDASEIGAAGRELHAAGQSALRAGKRVHAETTIDRHGASVVSVGLESATAMHPSGTPASAVVIGAGAMGVLAVNWLREAGVEDIVVVSRSRASADRVAVAHGVRAADFDDLELVLAGVDLAVACTGAADFVVHPNHVSAASELVLLDLALPRDVDPAVAEVPGTRLVDLADLARHVQRHSDAETAANAVLEEELSKYLADRAALAVQPVLVSLRSRGDAIVEEELQRLRLRLPALNDDIAEEVERAIRRAMSVLLHTPTVRMKELAADPDGERYSSALRALFDLDPEAIQEITGLGEDAG